jgi:hypothetical protein
MIKGIDEEETSSTASVDGGKWREARFSWWRSQWSPDLQTQESFIHSTVVSNSTY